ncbi:MAG: twin-arginine translocation signal domain-containing protein, partial [Pseudomonadota bacterium]
MISRRKFLKGSSATMALAGTGVTLGFAPQAFAQSTNNNALVLLFFRGGMDGLNLLVPRTGVNRSEYEAKRQNIRIPLDRIFNLNDAFGIPNTCPDLRDLYGSGDLSFIHSVGMPDGLGSRSHFDSQTMFEKGTPGDTSPQEGWLARHLNSNPALTGSAVIPSMAPGTNPESLVGDNNLMSIDSSDTDAFHPNGGRYSDEHMAALRAMYTGNSQLALSMRGTLDNVDILTDLSLDIPGFYPDSSLAEDLALVAQVIKADLGMHIATVDYGGWDTHQDMGNSGTGFFVDRLRVVSEA